MGGGIDCPSLPKFQVSCERSTLASQMLDSTLVWEHCAESWQQKGWVRSTAPALPVAVREHSKAHFVVGVSLAEHGRLLEAIERFRAALRIVPGWADAQFHLGAMLAKLGDLEGAESQLVA